MKSFSSRVSDLNNISNCVHIAKITWQTFQYELKYFSDQIIWFAIHIHFIDVYNYSLICICLVETSETKIVDEVV